MLLGLFWLQLLFRNLFSFIKNAGKNSVEKQPAKSKKGLVTTPLKGV
jgi:hypothetical protein